MDVTRKNSRRRLLLTANRRVPKQAGAAESHQPQKAGPVRSVWGQEDLPLAGTPDGQTCSLWDSEGCGWALPWASHTPVLQPWDPGCSFGDVTPVLWTL